MVPHICPGLADVGMASIHKSEIENQKCLVTPTRDPRHRQRSSNLLNLVCDIEGVVYLMCSMLPHVGSSPHSGRSSKPLSQPLRLVGFLRFTGFFVGPVGQPGVGSSNPTGLPTCKFQRPTPNRFSPGYPGLVC